MMSTSLKRQLAALASPSSSLLVPDRRRSSIIFTPQEAAKYNKETFYQIGLDGLNELISINPTLFSPFSESILFLETSMTFERAVEDAEANMKLDSVINRFIIAIHPYLMIKASLKCLEWLVYRFHIERFNVDAILQSILPYYDTKSFVIVVQVLEIEKFQRNREWEWIVPCIHSGAPLRKAVLFDNSNSKFILGLFHTFEQILNVHQQYPDNLRLYLGFMASTLVGILNKLKNDLVANPSKVQNKKIIGLNILDKIYKLLVSLRENTAYQNIKNNDEIYSMVYIVMAMLAVCCREIPGMTAVTGSCLKKIFKLINVNRGSAQLTETFLLMNLMINYLNRKWIFSSPTTFSNTLKDLAFVSQNWDLSNLAMNLILPNIDREDLLTPSKVFDFVLAIQLSPDVRSEILRNVYRHYRSTDSKVKWAKYFLTTFEKQYPLEFDLAIHRDEGFAADLAKYKSGKDFIMLSQHSSSSIRAESVKKLIKKSVGKGSILNKATKVKKASGKKLIKPYTTNKTIMLHKNKSLSSDKNRAAVALLPRFVDESSDVLLALLSPKLKTLKKIFSNQTLVKGLMSVVTKNVSLKTSKIAVAKLCQMARKLKEKELKLKQQIKSVIIPILFPRKPSQFKVAKIILKSKFAKEDNFLKQYLPVLEKEEDFTMMKLCEESFGLLSQIDSKQTFDFNFESAVQATFACLLYPSSELIKKINTVTEKIECVSCNVLFPVDKTSFSKCLALAEKKDKLSLELVLTALSKSPTKDVETIQTVTQFAWKSAERLENRDASMKFLSKYMQTCFKHTDEECRFWIKLLLNCCAKRRNTNSNENSDETEFLVIRAIQFTTAFIQKNTIANSQLDEPRISENSADEDCDINKPLTRTTRSKSKIVHSDSQVKSSPHNASKTRTKNPAQDIQPASQIWELIQLILSQCLRDDSYRIRVCSIKCLKSFKGSLKENKELDSFIEYILEFEKEITTDSQQICVVVNQALMDKDFATVKTLLMKSLTDENYDDNSKIEILNLCKYFGTQVFTELHSTILQLLKQNQSSNFLMEILNYYDSSVVDENILQETLKHKEMAKIVLKKIDRESFESYEATIKKKLMSLVIDKSLCCQMPEIKVAIQRCVRKWVLDASIVASELQKCIGMEKRSTMASDSIKKPVVKVRDQSSKKITKDLTQRQINQDWAARAEVVLEFVQGKQRISHKSKLIQPLFKILQTCITLEEQSPVEYLKQLVLTTLTICCQDDDISEQPKEFVSFNVDAVIDCLRCSRNPQTHHHALILLNYAANRFPEQVLHGVMSLFTFMGNSILRQDDTYSTQLIQQTVVTIIPTLATAGKGSTSPVVVSAGIYRVFTSAVQDIPMHRRLPVFTSLVETLEPKKTMWQLCIILVDNALQRDRKRSNLNADLELATNLVWIFDPDVVVDTMGLIYTFLASLPIFSKNISPEQFSSMKTRQTVMERSVLDFGRKESSRDVLIVMHYVLELVVLICSKFANIEDKKLEYDSLLEKCLLFSQKVSGLNEERIFRLIAHKNLEVIEKINTALQPLEFIEAVGLILIRDDLTVKRKVMEMLNQRILQKVEWFGELKNLLDLIPLLIEIAKQTPESDEMITLVQTALFSLKLLSKHLAVLHPDEFLPVFELANQLTGNKNKLLCASALLCLSELFCLKSLILPNLNSVTSAILKTFKASTKLQSLAIKSAQSEPTGELEQEKVNGPSNLSSEGEHSSMTAHLLCVSTITCLNKMIEHLGSFVGSKFLRKSLIAILFINSRYGEGDKANHRMKVFEQKLKLLLKSISLKIPLRNSLSAIKDAFTDLKIDSKGVCILIKLLRDTLTATSKADFTLIVHNLTDSFLEDFLSYRDKIEQSNAEEESVISSPENIDLVEDGVIDCLITGIILKMSESHFRPFYHKIFDWAGDDVNRLITFYRLSAAAAERLKSLFVTFASYVINQAVTVLSKDVRLGKAIVRFFYQIFSNDREGFVTTDRFNALVKPLVDLIESDFVLQGDIKISDVNDTLIQLAVATNDLNRWQYLIELISFKSNHANKVVRLNVLATLEAAATELSKDFLPLLPPAVPFLAELMNDDDADVESETQKLLLKLEDIVGEPLQPYFTT